MISISRGGITPNNNLAFDIPSLQSLSMKEVLTMDNDGIPTNPEFYNALAEESKGSPQQAFVLQLVEQMPLDVKAKLPLFEGACEKYIKLVLDDVFQSPQSKPINSMDRDPMVHFYNLNEDTVGRAKGNCCFKLMQFLQNNQIHSQDNQIQETKDLVLKQVAILNKKEAFTYLQFYDLNLDNYNFSELNLNLTGTVFAYGSAQHVNLSNTNLSYVCVYDTNFKNANFLLANMSGFYSDSANLEGANLSRTTLKQASFYFTDLSNSTLVGSTLEKTTVYNVKFNSADLTSTDPDQLINTGTTSFNEAKVPDSELKNKILKKYPNLKFG